MASVSSPMSKEAIEAKQKREYTVTYLVGMVIIFISVMYQIEKRRTNPTQVPSGNPNVITVMASGNGCTVVQRGDTLYAMWQRIKDQTGTSWTDAKARRTWSHPNTFQPGETYCP